MVAAANDRGSGSGSPRGIIALSWSGDSGPTSSDPSRQSSLAPPPYQAGLPPSRHASLAPSGAGSRLSYRAALSTAEGALWDIPFDQLQIKEQIGEGAFGRVRAAPTAVVQGCLTDRS
jgi:hypothetical protein